MSWYDENLQYRYPVRIDATASGASPVDVQFDVPDQWDDFWDNVESDHADVVVALSDGGTLATFDFQSWTYATKTCIIEVDAMAIETNKINLLWLYWGDSTHIDESSAFVPAAPIQGYVDLNEPTEHRVVFRSEDPGVVTPTQEVAKTTNEEILVWWDVSSVFAKSGVSLYGQRTLEELKSIASLTVEASGADQAAMHDDADSMITMEAYSRMWIGTFIKGGSDATNYTIVLQLLLNSTNAVEQTVEARVLLKVNDPSE